MKKPYFVNKISMPVVGIIFCCSIASINAQNVTIDMTPSYQKIVGIGTHGLEDAARNLSPAFYRVVVDREYAGELEQSANDNNDVNVTDLSKFNWNTDVTDFAKVEYAKSNPAFFIASVFSPPGWMKDMSASPYSVYNMGGKELLETWSPCNLNRDPSLRYLCGGKLRTDMQDEFAEWVAGWAKKWKAVTGKDLYAISIQNEPQFNESYGSCVYSVAELASTANKVAQRFQKDGLKVKIFHGEILWAQQNVIDYFSATLVYPDLLNQLQGFAVHNYDTDGIKVGGASSKQWETTYKFATKTNKEAWMSETSGWSEDTDGMMTYLGQLYTALFSGNVALWCQFTKVADPSKKETNILYNAFRVAFKIKPNSIRCDAISDNSKILSLAFKDYDKQTVTLMLINSTDQDMDVTINGSALSGDMEMFCSNPTKRTESIGKFNSAASYKLKIPKQSISVGTTSANVPKPTAIEQLAETEEALSFYPNPAQDVLNVNMKNKGIIQITDLAGHLVEERQMTEGNNVINISNITTGFYIIAHYIWQEVFNRPTFSYQFPNISCTNIEQWSFKKFNMRVLYKLIVRLI
jgi:O-glycosyl hydrolase